MGGQFLNVPIYLVRVRDVFFRLTIRDRRPFIVSAKAVTFRAVDHARIGRIPGREAPSRQAFHRYFPISSVVVDLMVLQVPPAKDGPPFRKVLLVMSTHPYPVFTSNGLVLQVYLVVNVRPFPRVKEEATVPARVLIPNCRVDRLVCVVIMEGRTNEYYRTDQILLVNRIIRFLSVLNQVISSNLRLVRRPPRASQQVVVVLTGRFFRLLFPILPREELISMTLILMSTQPSLQGFDPNSGSMFVRRIVGMDHLQVVDRAGNVDPRLSRGNHVFVIVRFVGHVSPFHPVLITTCSFRFRVFPVRGRAFLNVRVVVTRTW